MNPKLFARLVRFERMMREGRGGAQSWAELALAHGYCDQAHLAREVARFTGLTPTGAAGFPGKFRPRLFRLLALTLPPWLKATSTSPRRSSTSRIAAAPRRSP